METLTQRLSVRLSLAVALAVVAPMATAYIGPGSGISVIGSLLGLLATIVLTIGTIVLFPVRRLLKRRRARAEAAKVQGDKPPEPVAAAAVKESAEAP